MSVPSAARERRDKKAVGSIGSRLRLVLRQPGFGKAPGAVDAADLPEIEFVAYSTSERLSGRIRLDAARLTDMLNTHREYVLLDMLTPHLAEYDLVLIDCRPGVDLSVTNALTAARDTLGGAAAASP